MDTSLENIKNQLLLVSAANGEVKNITKYLKEGAFIDVKDANGYTPLMCAAFNKHMEAVKILVEAGANVNLKDTRTYGFTVLHFAAAYGLLDMTRAILKTKQNNIHEIKSTKQGKTALELASTKEIQDLLANDIIDRSENVNKVEEKVEKKDEKEISQPLLKNVEQNLENIQNVERNIEQVENLDDDVVERRKRRCKKCKRVFRGIGVFFSVFLTLLHLWFTPYGFPLFIYPVGLIITIAGISKLRKRKEKLEQSNSYGLSIHGWIYFMINAIFVWSNIWAGGFPWSLFGVAIGALFLSIHALKTKYSLSKYNTKFHIHAIFFGVFTFLVLVMYLFGSCNSLRSHSRRPYVQNRRYEMDLNRWGHNRWGKHKGHKNYYRHRYGHSRHHLRNQFCARNIFGFFLFMIPVMIWAVILAIHYVRFKKVKNFGCCGMKVSLNNQQTETIN